MRSTRTRMASGASRPRPGGGRDRLRVVVPGWPQWRRGQRSRAAVLAGSYLSALAVGLFAWGTGMGAALIGFAIVAHAASMADAIRQAAFPGFGPWAPWFSAGVSLGAACYGPALAVALQVAFPARDPVGGFLVNRAAYASGRPEPGHWVWLDRPGPGRPRSVARVVAVGGQVVSWAGDALLVDGRPPAFPIGPAGPGRGSSGRFEVPHGALLVVGPDPAGEGDPAGDGPAANLLAIVPADRAIGRPWARSYPVWRRELLSRAGPADGDRGDPAEEFRKRSSSLA